MIGWIGNAFFILGAVLVAKKKIHGFSCNMIGNVCYTAIGIMHGPFSLIAISVVLFGITVASAVSDKEAVPLRIEDEIQQVSVEAMSISGRWLATASGWTGSPLSIH